MIPVPVFYPDVTEILGRPVYRRVRDVPGGPVDIVDVFRRPEVRRGSHAPAGRPVRRAAAAARRQDVPGHLEDLLAARPACVWLQSGIRNDAVAAQLAAAGILVVQDRCLMVEHRAAAAEAKL